VEKTDSLAAARDYSARISASLPAAIDLLGLCQRYKTAGKAHILRECLIWRQEELARNALSSLDAVDGVTSALLARAVIETTAMTMYIHDIVKRGVTKGIHEGDDEKLTGLLTGSRIWPELPGAVNVLTMIDKVEKLVPGVRHSYDTLSEMAHPNWSGMQGAYATTDQENLMVYFSRGGRNPDGFKRGIAPSLAGSLGLFLHFYDQLGDLLEPYAAACKAHYGGGGEEAAP
jgi:hypothetical protein